MTRTEQAAQDHMRVCYPNSAQIDEVMDYINIGKPMGDFLNAVFRHDLFDAVNHADPSNGLVLRDIVRWIHSFAPPQCHGSEEAIKQWVNHQGLRAEFREIEDTVADDARDGFSFFASDFDVDGSPALAITAPIAQNDTDGPFFGSTPGD